MEIDGALAAQNEVGNLKPWNLTLCEYVLDHKINVW